MRELFEKLIILKQHGSARAGGQGILIVGDRCAGRGGQSFIAHALRVREATSSFKPIVSI